MVDSSGVDWRLGVAQQNPGNAFMDAFKQGQQQRQQYETRQAMSALAQNPNDTEALAMLAKADPATAMAYRKQQIEYHKAQVADQQDAILKGAQIIRELNPTDQKGWDQARALAAQSGIDISRVPAEFNPQYVTGLTHLADAFKPAPQDPGIIREYDEAMKRGLVPQGTSFTQYATMRNPGMSAPVTIPYGAQVTAGNPPAGNPMPSVSTPDDAAKLPPGTQFRLPDGRIGTVPGGAGGNASGGFPGRY